MQFHSLAELPHVARRPAGSQVRGRSRRKTTVAGLIDEVEKQLVRINSRGCFLYCDLEIGKRGKPISRSPEPRDSAVGLRFWTQEGWKVIFCDRFDRVRDNFLEVVTLLEAMVTAETSHARYFRFETGAQSSGGARRVWVDDRQAEKEPPWWCGVLGVKETDGHEEIRAAYVQKVKQCHPDLAQGEADRVFRENQVKRVNSAYESAKKAAAARSRS